MDEAILGSSNFTVHGLGLAANGNNIELNLEVDSNRDRRDLKAWFDELWSDETLVRDVKAEVLSYLEQLYQDRLGTAGPSHPRRARHWQRAEQDDTGLHGVQPDLDDLLARVQAA